MEEQRRGEGDRVHAVDDSAVVLDNPAPVFDSDIALDRRQDKAAEEPADDQYVFGKLFGPTRLSPAISPANTVEGLVGDGLTAVLNAGPAGA